jgi:hypothetical protein
MGLLEHQALYSFRGVAHDGWLCTFTILYNSSLKFHQLAAGQLLSGQPVRYRKAGGTARPSHSKSHLPDHSPQATRRAAVLVQPSIAFGLIVQYSGNHLPGAVASGKVLKVWWDPKRRRAWAS